MAEAVAGEDDGLGRDQALLAPLRLDMRAADRAAIDEEPGTGLALVETSVWMAGRLGKPSPSRVVTALAGG